MYMDIYIFLINKNNNNNNKKKKNMENINV